MTVITYSRGDILEAQAEALVNTVNCVGVMGRGVALQFKNAFPENFKAYAAACEVGEVQPGRMFIHETGQLSPRWIINFPTKRHWRSNSRIEDIKSGMKALRREIREREIESIAIPPLGSGLGGLQWQDVRPLIEEELTDLPNVRVTLFEPGSRQGELKAAKVPKMTAGRAALVGLVRRYLAGMMEPSISLLEVHKLMYFLQAAGEPLKLKYQKAPQGPFAENLRHVLIAINGYLITGYTADKDSPSEQIALVAGASEKADRFLSEHPETNRRFDRVAAVADGFETPFGLELLATTHWVAEKVADPTDEAVERAFYDWGPRKSRFQPEQVGIALERLRSEGWIAAPGA